MSALLGFLIVFGIPILLIKIGLGIGKKKKEKLLLQLKMNYEEALKGTDKKTALDMGRLYYASVRKGGVLTIYDEQAITNDLSSMKNHIP